MTFKIGDRVKFLNDIGGGVITGFMENKLVNVRGEDGFEMPVLATDLLLDEGSGYGMDGEPRETQSGNSAPPKRDVVKKISAEEFRHKKFDGKVLLAIVPSNEQLLHVSDFEVYLINDSNYDAYYVLGMVDTSVPILVGSGKLESDTKLAVKKLSQSEITKVKELRLQVLFSKAGLFEQVKPVDLIFNLEGFSFYKNNHFADNDYFYEKALILEKEEIDLKEAYEKLSENDIFKASKEKEPKIKEPKPKKKINPAIEEVDLHIEAIVEDHKDLSNAEIVEIQMGRFETALETAINGKTPKIVFIHGVGNGRLKHELRKKLDRKYPDLKYQDASFKEYGYGATLVTLR